MQIVVALVIAGMTVFAVWSAFREIKLYRNYLHGNPEYLISRRRRNRRLIIAGLLILEAGFLFAGIFILSFSDPLKALTFWISPLLLIIWLVYLGLNDFRETSRDIDMIIRETSDVILKKQN
ncbi:MAG TPA: hypothetical protein VKE92_00700 [Anaerolineales bacterium]|nr:hypothetical protein [Anaerolineales bacterium]